MDEGPSTSRGKETSRHRRKPKTKRCLLCNRGLNNKNLKIHARNPPNSVNECMAITDDRLEYSDDEEIPCYNVTGYSIYDKEGHMYSLDSGGIKSRVVLFFSGYLKILTNTRGDVEDDNVPVKEAGPIIQWGISGLDKYRSFVFICTRYGHYNLLQPSDEYAPFMKNLFVKMTITRVTIQYLEDFASPDTDYNKLLSAIEKKSIVEIDNKQLTERMLIKHKHFLYKHMKNINCRLTTLPCVQQLMKREKNEIPKQKKTKQNVHTTWSKATTTPRVLEVFENFFPKHMDKSDKKKSIGGHKRKHESTKQYFDIDSDSDKMKIIWSGDVVTTYDEKFYYNAVKIDDHEVTVGDFVMIKSMPKNTLPTIMKVQYMWKESKNPKGGYFHGQTFTKSVNTVIGELGDASELFQEDVCHVRVPFSYVIKTVNVKKIVISYKEWFETDVKNATEKKSLQDDEYFFSKLYNRKYGSFEDLPVDPPCPNIKRKHRFCPVCERSNIIFLKKIPKVVEKLTGVIDLNNPKMNEWGAVKWRDSFYRKGDTVFLKPDTFVLENSYMKTKNRKTEIKDEKIYTEFFRKTHSRIRRSNLDINIPYCIGYITAVVAEDDDLCPIVFPQNIYLKVNVMYRPENTVKEEPYKDDLNLVYWSEENKTVRFSKVVGLCELSYVDNIPANLSISEWSSMDHNRFYFKEAYDNDTKEFKCVAEYTKKIGLNLKHKKITSKEIKEPLKMFDIFAGCGGLSEGLKQSGIAKPFWAIELVSPAATSYELNNTNCTVFNEDCNKLLKNMMDGETFTEDNKKFPVRGEVDLMSGGPPCQGFSLINRFNFYDYSNFKNSLIVTFLSYCDFFRPKYFILENVRDFAKYKNGMVLKLTLKCLLSIGYQCSFSILQAGCYGIPQTRRRLIILAAAPGYKLPGYPTPTHAFNRILCSLKLQIDGVYYTCGLINNSAPKRVCTIRDAICDLPKIPSGANKSVMKYDCEAQTGFQRSVRITYSIQLNDHICKAVTPLIQARIDRIPTTPNADWRDLPNIQVKLSNNTMTNVLSYNYHNIKSGKGPDGKLRGVCPCAMKKRCDPLANQVNTLIPWCLPHTANRHGNWSGVYGRVSWDDHFSTTLTDPSPGSKQGRVLHPDQNRIVSVRECARSQGFSDTYIFVGNITEKYRQIGNAVPPPLGAAIGREIKKSLIMSLTE